MMLLGSDCCRCVVPQNSFPERFEPLSTFLVGTLSYLKRIEETDVPVGVVDSVENSDGKASQCSKCGVEKSWRAMHMIHSIGKAGETLHNYTHVCAKL